jgi:hypothetical protein
MTLSNRKFAVLFSAVSAMSLLVACGDSDEEPDARPDPGAIDAAPTPDAPTPDAAPSFSGSILFQEVRFQNPEIPLGSGIQANISFQDDLTADQPVFAVGIANPTMPGPTDGCFVFDSTADEAKILPLNEGEVTLTTTGASPVIPKCVFVPTRGYQCPAGGGQANISVTANGNLTANVKIEGATFDVNAIGRYLVVMAPFPMGEGANGVAPIVAVAGADTVVIFSPGAKTTTAAVAGNWAALAAVGPSPVPDLNMNGMADDNPNTFGDDQDLKITFKAGAGSHFADFEASFPATGGIKGPGDAFTLDTASQAVITNIPVDGSEFTIGCDGAGGTCGTATGSILVITTTDTMPGASPIDMPLPTNQRITIRCVAIGAKKFTVPAKASEYIMKSNAKRIQASFIRGNLSPQGKVNVIAAHSVVGITNIGNK